MTPEKTGTAWNGFWHIPSVRTLKNSVEFKESKEMKYDILTDTAFFRAAQNGNIDEMKANYSDFIDKVIEVCGCADGKTLTFATLVYTEIELKALTIEGFDGQRQIEKAMSFLTDMQKMVEQMPVSEIKSMKKNETTLRWTGGVANLVELVYGLVEMGCVNDGDVTIGNLGNQVFGLFGLDPIPYSRTYTNIKGRSVQNGGRAYFLTEMRQLLNERIDQDARIMRGR